MKCIILKFRKIYKAYFLNFSLKKFNEEYKRFKNLADRIIAVCTGKSAQRYLSKNMIAYLLKLKTYLEKGELGNVKKLEKAIINEFSKLETQIEEKLKKAA